MKKKRGSDATNERVGVMAADAGFASEPARRDDSPSNLPDVELKRLMRRAFDEERLEVDVLGGVQKRLRERSGGKFYKDGWSTSRHPPFSTYFITALLMLATVVLLYVMIAPVVPDPIPGRAPAVSTRP